MFESVDTESFKKLYEKIYPHCRAMDSTSSKENEQNEVTTLYVGNLSLKTSDSDIYRLFSTVGVLASVKLIRPSNDQFYFKPTCYAYVSYKKQSDAEEAINKLNFYEMHGVQMRVMVCDKNIFKNDTGNIVVKNLPEDVDDKTLYDTFSLFGKIISSKVSYRNGKSLGYGYVQYVDKKSAKKAVKLGTGTRMNQNILKVEKYEKKNTNPHDSFTNVYIKNFPPNTQESFLKEILEKHGEILSFCIPKKENGELKGFAFCDFKNTECAKNAVRELHNKPIFDMPEMFYVQRAQSRKERDMELRNSLAKLSVEGKSFKRNLYVTNIPKNCGEKEVKSVFSKYGSIISISVEPDLKSRHNMNFAYVCFLKPEEANMALEDPNTVTLNGNRLYISLFKCKRERELEKENSKIIYQPGLNFYSRSGSGGNVYNKKSSSAQNTKSYDDLYKLVYSLAPTYQDAWDSVDVKNKSEFADKVTHMLLKKSRIEIRNMIELSSILVENVSDVVKQYGESNLTELFLRKSERPYSS